MNAHSYTYAVHSSTPKDLGHLIIWRMADVAAPYAELENLARQVGFDTGYVPTPPRARHAWEKATNIKKQKLVAPQVLIDQVKAEYGCEPIVFAETKVVSGNEDYGLLRHLVRSVVIKAAGEKDKQLDMKSVAMLRFDDTKTSDLDKFVGMYHSDWDPAGATNGNVKALILRMQTEYEKQLQTADGQDVRDKVRQYLERELKAKCLADGTYFVRDNVAGAEAKLQALQEYILGLGKWKQTDNPLTCQVYKVADDGSAFAERNRREIAVGVAEQFGKELAAILKDLSEPDGRGSQATRKRIEQASALFLETKNEVKAYREALEDDLQSLNDMLHMCQNAMLRAQDEMHA